MFPQSFEQLWVACENLNDGSPETQEQIIDELHLKTKLYQSLSQKLDLPEDEQQSIRTRTMGEILFTLTKLSLQDNINVFEALETARQYRTHNKV